PRLRRPAADSSPSSPGRRNHSAARFRVARPPACGSNTTAPADFRDFFPRTGAAMHGGTPVPSASSTADVCERHAGVLCERQSLVSLHFVVSRSLFGGAL